MEMPARRSRALFSTCLVWLGVASLVWAITAQGAVTQPPDPLENAMKDVTQGALRIVKEGGEVVECVLKHTDVQADVVSHGHQHLHSPLLV